MTRQNSLYSFEICVETPDALDACVGVADRIELCCGLDVGGLTPSFGLMEKAKLSGVETHVLIRPRAGDFMMTPADLAVAVADIHAVRRVGLKGVVIGAERGGALDRTAIDAMVQAAGGIDVALHRVIDVVDDPVAAMEVAIECGFVRILTSGSASSAPQGIAGLDRLQKASAGRIEIMAGAGITSVNIGDILNYTDITSFHSSCSAKIALGPRYSEFGFGEVIRSFDLAEATKIAARLAQATTEE